MICYKQCCSRGPLVTIDGEGNNPAKLSDEDNDQRHQQDNYSNDEGQLVKVPG